MPRSRSLLLVGVLAVIAAAVGGLVGSHWLRGTSSVASTPPKAETGSASLFVAADGDDGGRCGAGSPCRTWDRAFHVAHVGQVVEVAGGAYGDVALTAVEGRTGAGCESRRRLASCVVFRPARGARVEVGNLNLGDDYKKAGPAGVAVVAGRGSGGGSLVASSVNFNQARETSTRGVVAKNLYVAGGRDIAFRGGRVGGQSSPDGLHPEIQGVYGAVPAIVPTRLTIEGVDFHDINTTSPTAHVDCLQVESAVGMVIRRNTFRGCGSAGLRISYGGGANENPPRGLLIERNVFRKCVDTPVSPCYYAAQVGIGHDVVVRGNVSEQEFQPADDPALMENVRYERNAGWGVKCERGVTYVGNAWVRGRCSKSDKKLAASKLRALLR